MINNTKTEYSLQQRVNDIAEELNDMVNNNPETKALEMFEEYYSELLDTRYFIDFNKEYLSCELLITYGGPNIYINTSLRVVEGFESGLRVEAHLLNDVVDMIDDYVREIYDCT